MLRNAQGQLLYVGQLIRSAIESRPAAVSGLFTLNRKPAKLEMSVESGMIQMLLDRLASLLRVLSAGALLGCASSAIVYAAVAQQMISVSGVSLRRDEVGVNDLSITIGDRIIISADTVTPNGAQGTTATAQTTYLSGPQTGQLFSIGLPFSPQTADPNQFTTSIPYDSNLTGPWTETFTNAATTNSPYTVTTPSIEGVAPAPTPINVTALGLSSLNPTFTWSYPTSIDGVEVLIYELGIHVKPSTGEVVSGGSDFVFFQNLPGATNLYTLPTQLDDGFTVTPGIDYVVALKAVILCQLSIRTGFTTST
jgi:hypothetical protein